MSPENDPKENGKKQPITNDPDEAITTPEEVQESNDEKIDQDYPGYPHYPAKDDILNPENNAGQAEVDVENITRSNESTSDFFGDFVGKRYEKKDVSSLDKENGSFTKYSAGTDADVTAEDLAMLGDRNQDIDLGEDEVLKSRGWTPSDGEDLDVPGSELDDNFAQEDEENNYYSLGGDNNK